MAAPAATTKRALCAIARCLKGMLPPTSHIPRNHAVGNWTLQDESPVDEIKLRPSLGPLRRHGISGSFGLRPSPIVLAKTGRGCIARRDHGVIGRQTPFGAILVLRQPIVVDRWRFKQFEFLPVLEGDDVVCVIDFLIGQQA